MKSSQVGKFNILVAELAGLKNLTAYKRKHCSKEVLTQERRYILQLINDIDSSVAITQM
jgi:hypothetical protein